MKYIVTLVDVYLDINGGEYSEHVKAPLFLGVIESNTIDEAYIEAEKVEEKFYDEQNTNAYFYGHPCVKVEKC